MGKTTISWAKLGLAYGESINPIRAKNKETGKEGHFCVKYGPGCVTCYASAHNTNPLNVARNCATGLEYITSNRSKVELVWDDKHATRPFRTSRPTGFFPADMTDWLGWDWDLPKAWSYRLLAACAIAPWNRYFLLTKRYKFLAELVQSDYNNLSLKETDNLGIKKLKPASDLAIGSLARGYDLFAARNIWPGVSICTQADADKALPYLKQIRDTFDAKNIHTIIGVSYEPCLEVINWTPFIGMIDWIISGGESDQRINGVLVKGRPATPEMFQSVIEFSGYTGVPIFNKQLGNRLAEQMGISGKGANPEEWPDWLQTQEFPEV